LFVCYVIYEEAAVEFVEVFCTFETTLVVVVVVVLVLLTSEILLESSFAVIIGCLSISAGEILLFSSTVRARLMKSLLSSEISVP
jgi:hypothetical protein